MTAAGQIDQDWDREDCLKCFIQAVPEWFTVEHHLSRIETDLIWDQFVVDVFRLYFHTVNLNSLKVASHSSAHCSKRADGIKYKTHVYYTRSADNSVPTDLQFQLTIAVRKLPIKSHALVGVASSFSQSIASTKRTKTLALNKHMKQIQHKIRFTIQQKMQSINKGQIEKKQTTIRNKYKYDVIKQIKCEL